MSYELVIGGVKAIRHRKFLRKVDIPHDTDRRIFSEQSSDQGRQLGHDNADRRVFIDNEQSKVKGRQPGEQRQPAESGTVKPRRSERLRNK